jgi:hypothetical protein
VAKLPFRKPKTRTQKALETAQSALKVYTSMKVAQAGPKAAKQVAKGYAGMKATKAGGRGAARLAKLAAIPAAIAGVAVIVKKRSGSAGEPAVFDAPVAPSPPPVAPPPPPAGDEASPAGAAGGGDDDAPLPGEPGGLKSGTTIASPSSATTGATPGDGEPAPGGDGGPSSPAA